VYDVIVDIDGTIADNSHRVHHIRKHPKDWKSYEMGVMDDKPHFDIIYILESLETCGAKLLLCTGRMENERDSTINWLKIHYLDFLFDKLYMRSLNDYRSDDVVKKELLDQIRKDGYNPTIVFEDRQRVVDMWRTEGLRCLQVQPGDF
jgi:hypothetical protein